MTAAILSTSPNDQYTQKYTTNELNYVPYHYVDRKKMRTSQTNSNFCQNTDTTCIILWHIRTLETCSNFCQNTDRTCIILRHEDIPTLNSIAIYLLSDKRKIVASINSSRNEKVFFTFTFFAT